MLANVNHAGKGQKMTATSPIASDRFINVRSVSEITGLSRTTIYRFMGAGDFPKSYKLSPRRVAWSMTDVDQWVRGRKSERAA